MLGREWAYNQNMSAKHSKKKNAEQTLLSDRQQRILSFLEDTPVGVLSSVDPNGDPHGVVIYFVIDGDFNVYLLTRAETRKSDNLKHHNHVMLTVFDPQNQTTAQITGRAREIEDDYQVNEIANQVLQASFKVSDSEVPPIAKLDAGESVAFKIEPVQIRMAVYARPEFGDYRELFESIESFNLRET